MRGGAIFTDKDNIFQNCTITGNTAGRYGGGLLTQLFSSPLLSNCILWGDTPDELHTILGSDPEVSFCDIEGGWEGEGNIAAFPRFFDPENGDYRLHTDSPCIDAGDPSTAVPHGGGDRVDMGALEYAYPEHTPLSLTFEDTPVSGHPGETVVWDFLLENKEDEQVIFDAWIAVSGRNNSIRDSILDVTIPPKTVQSGKVYLWIPHDALPGEYTVKGRVGLIHEEIWDGEVFDGQVLQGTAITRESSSRGAFALRVTL
jgi:hypothetical protein